MLKFVFEDEIESVSIAQQRIRVVNLYPSRVVSDAGANLREKLFHFRRAKATP